MKDYLLEMIENKPVGLFNYKDDILLENNLVGKKPEIEAEMADKLRAIIQAYNSRLIDDNMVATPASTP
jgi:hypothetical protein